jgi:hypothetical protein
VRVSLLRSRIIIENRVYTRAYAVELYREEFHERLGY